MSLSIGLVGLPNVGKSTLFNALTDADALVANYPFATIEPNTGIVPVPDPRLEKLAALYNTSKIVPATVKFVDIAGLVENAAAGEGLGNQFLSHIRSASAICHVVRAFSDDNVTKSGSSNPQSDIEIVNTELVLADLQTVGRALPRLEKEAKANLKLQPVFTELERLKQILETGKPLWEKFGPRVSSLESTADLFLLTAKPVIYVFNVDETALQGGSLHQELAAMVKPAKALLVCAKLESELRGLDENDRFELLASYGQNENGLAQLIHVAYEVLGLQSFLTAGEKEVRAWTIPAGSTAPQAAGTIHGDMERGFIAAQVISFQDLLAAGSIPAARNMGKVRTEGKDYIMQPDDVVEFRFNV